MEHGCHMPLCCGQDSARVLPPAVMLRTSVHADEMAMEVVVWRGMAGASH